MRVFTVSRGSIQKLATRTRTAGTKTALSNQRLFNTHPSHPSRARAFSEHQPAFYDQLKNEERRQFDRKRIRVDSQRNDTCTLTLNSSKVQLLSKLNDEKALLSMCENYIIEHASRRVDLFFYTLIAYYKTSILPVEGRTNFQYGIGQSVGTSGTQACHSSFTPSLLDKTIFENEGDQVKYKSLLSRTHFSQSLNATVELPAFVNAFDDILEIICRPMCLAILRDVSLAKINPIHGLVSFLTMMDTLLQNFKQQALSEKYTALTYPNLHAHRYVNPKLIDLVIEGTLDTSYDNKSHTVNDCYLQLLLRMTSQEKKLCEQNSKNKKKIYLEKIFAIQSEILGTESQESVCAI